MAMNHPRGSDRWRMECDGCGYADEWVHRLPALEIYVEKGWFIGYLRDYCPTCRPEGPPHPVMSGRDFPVGAEPLPRGIIGALFARRG